MTLDWLNRFLHTSFTENELLPIQNFALLWNILEGKYFNQSFSSRDAAIVINNLTITPNQYTHIFEYFKNRYTSNNQTNNRFDQLRLRQNDNPELVRDVLLGVRTTQPEIILALLIIVYRYRNNLFHGIKEMHRIDGQIDNFTNANSFLMLLIESMANR